MAAATKVFDRRNAVTGWLTRPDGAPEAASDVTPVAPAVEGETN